LRIGLRDSKVKKKPRFEVEPLSLGFCAGIDPDKLNQLLDDMEVEKFARKLSR
jgi:hypothetical protein